MRRVERTAAAIAPLERTYTLRSNTPNASVYALVNSLQLTDCLRGGRSRRF